MNADHVLAFGAGALVGAWVALQCVLAMLRRSPDGVGGDDGH